MSTFPMTPSSGGAFNPDGGFSFGVECFFPRMNPTPNTPNIAQMSFPVPDDLYYFSGVASVALRPPTPEWSSFGKPKVFITDGLFRVWVEAPGQPPLMVVNVILKATMEPQNLAVMGDCSLPTISQYGERTLVVEFQQAGAGHGGNMELQYCGEWK